MSDARAALVEIVERRKKPEPGSRDWGIVVPNQVRINGQEIVIPRDRPITVHDMTADDAVLVTLTVYARRVFVGHEDIDASVIDAVSAATTALADATRAAEDAQRLYRDAVLQAQCDLEQARQQLAEATRD